MATPPQHPVPSGNTFDKYASKNPISRILVKGFLRTHREMLTGLDAAVTLDIGCGEGHLLPRVREACPTAQLLAFDLDPGILGQARDACPESRCFAADAAALPLTAGSVNLAVASEVLEHLPDPAAAMREIWRVLSPGATLILSVPWEPTWRILNLARGAYIRDFGNTPGHLNHFRRRDILQLVQQSGFRVEEVRRPLPWTFVRAVRSDRP